MDAETIVKGLTEAQRRVVMSLPADGEFGPASSHQTARYMWYGIGKGRATRLVEHRHRADNLWRLNVTGLAVREVLLRNAGEG